MNRLNEKKGITLIALIITVIVLLILAGVSINALVGDNGVIENTQRAKENTSISVELEDLQSALIEYNPKLLGDVDDEEIDEMIDDLLANHLIDWIDGIVDEDDGTYLDYNQYMDENEQLFLWVKKGDNSYKIFINDDGTYTPEYMDSAIDEVGGGTLIGGTYIVTKAAFSSGEGLSDDEKGKFTIGGKTKVIFNESLGTNDSGKEKSGERFCIQIENGANAKLYFNYDKNTKSPDGKTYYYLTNEGLNRSAIDVNPGGKLDIRVAKNTIVIVDSGFGIEGGSGLSIEDMYGGPGGYAGIRVPLNAELLLRGKGVLYAYGGDASDGGTCVYSEVDWGAGGGGGAGAGIGGNGGKGGDSKSGFTPDALPGESCGKVSIYGLIEVYAYGGGGASGGNGTPTQGKGGGGGRGRLSCSGNRWWPEVGGSAGNTRDSGAGFSSGGGEPCSIANGTGIGGNNGLSGNTSAVYGTSGSYYENGKVISSSPNIIGKIGGSGFLENNGDNYKIGDGGIGGAGGDVYIEGSKSRVHAYNGSYITTVSSSSQNDNWRQTNQTVIYAQLGYDIKKIRDKGTISKITSRTVSALVTELSSCSDCRTIIYDVYTRYGALGIGSGAGSTETSNGSLTIN